MFPTKVEFGSDVAVSMPRAPQRTGVEVPMYGFVFTENGLMHDLTQADHERLAVPTYGPALDPDTEVVYGDGR